MIICTSICSNYLPKAMVLAKSVKENNPDTRFVVCLLEREVNKEAVAFQYFDEIVLAKDMGFENFDKYIFKHSIVEAATSVKGQLFVYILKKYSEESKVIYLDPDIKVFGLLAELGEKLNHHPIVVTPHLAHPEEIVDAVMDNELCALKHGVYNLGFLGISRSEESIRFIDWWTSRLNMFCYDDIPNGIFTDQKWIDLAPCFFDVHIFKHPGYNIAPWNLSKRKVTQAEDGQYLVNKEPLRFFHFSGFDSGDNEAMINKYVPNKKDLIYIIRNKYIDELEQMNQKALGRLPWSYDFYETGEKINREARLIYRDYPELYFKIENPFHKDNYTFNNYKRNFCNAVESDYKKNIVFRIIKKVKNKMMKR